MKGWCCIVIVRRLLFSILIVYLSWTYTASADDGVFALDEAIHKALLSNPELKVSKERWDVFKARPSRAGAFDDPKFSFNFMNLPSGSLDYDRFNMTQKQILFTQKLPFFGKRSLRREVAQKEAEAVGQEYSDNENVLVRKVKETYYDLYFINKAIEITEQNKELTKEFVVIAETKYAVGKGIQQDVLKAQVELSKMINDLIVLQQKKETKVARLNALLYRPQDSPVGELEEVTKADLDLDFEELRDIAREKSPLLKGLDILIERSRSAYFLARKDYYPDLNVAFAYGQRESREDFMTALFTINIPLWYKSKQNYRVREAEAQIRLDKERYNTMVNEISFLLKDTLAELQRDENLIQLYKTGIIPQAQGSLESAISGYQVDKIDFLTLLDNQITLLKFQIDYYRFTTDYQKKLAELEEVIGQRLF